MLSHVVQLVQHSGTGCSAPCVLHSCLHLSLLTSHGGYRRRVSSHTGVRCSCVTSATHSSLLCVSSHVFLLLLSVHLRLQLGLSLRQLLLSLQFLNESNERVSNINVVTACSFSFFLFCSSSYSLFILSCCS